MKKDRKKWIVVIFILFILIGAGSYGLISYSKVGNKVNQITTGSITMKYTESSNALVLSNAVPLTDEEGKREKEQVFDFTVSIDVTGDFSVSYEVVAEKEADSTLEDENIKPLEDQYIKLYLERSNDGKNYEEVMAPTIYTPITETTSFGAPAGSMILETGVVTETTKYHYRLRMWVDGSYERENEPRTYAVKVNVYGTTEKNTLDETGPVCRLEPSGEINVSKETEVKLICTDATTGLVEKRLTIEDFINSNEEVGTITGISDPVKTANGYEYTLMIQGNKVGTTTISLKEGVLEDSLGNQNTMIPNELNIKGLTYTVRYNKGDHIKTIFKDRDSCTTIEDQVTCQITLPEITTESGYQEDGWYLEDTLIGKGNTSYTIGSDTTLSAKAKLNSYTVTYDYASNGGSSSSKTTDIVNYQAEIDFAPTAEKAGYTFVGWNTNQDAHEGLKSLTMKDQDVTLYAIYQKEVEATFYYYDGTHQASTSTTCSFYNLEESCNYTVPEVVTSSVGPNESTYKGVSTNPSSEEITTTMNSLTTSYYAVYQGRWTITYKVGANVKENGIGSTDDGSSCDMVVTSDGESYTGSSCTIQTLPTITKKEGYDNENDISVWSTESGATEGSEPGNSYTLTGNITLYANGVDKTRPTITMKVDNTDYQQSHTVTVTLSDTGSGLAESAQFEYGWSTSNTAIPTEWTEKTINNTSGVKSNTFTVDGNSFTGIYYLWVKPVDYKDVVENWSTEGVISSVVKFDNTAPTVTFSLEEDSNANATDQSTRYTKTKSVAVALSDEYSGVVDNKIIQYTWCKADDSTCTGWTDVSPSSTTTDSDGKKIVTYTINQGSLTGKYYLALNSASIGDMAINKLSENPRTTGEFYFDNTAPTCNGLEYSTDGANFTSIAPTNDTWTTKDRIVRATCRDSDSGCDTLPSKAFTASTGTPNLSLTITDKAGNETKCNVDSDGNPLPVNVYVEKYADLAKPLLGGSEFDSNHKWYAGADMVEVTPDRTIVWVTNPGELSRYSGVEKYQFCISTTPESCSNMREKIDLVKGSYNAPTRTSTYSVYDDVAETIDVFDAAYYAQMSFNGSAPQDTGVGTGRYGSLMYQHWKNSGIKRGIRASDEFDPEYYGENNGSAIEACKNYMSAGDYTNKYYECTTNYYINNSNIDEAKLNLRNPNEDKWVRSAQMFEKSTQPIYIFFYVYTKAGNVVISDKSQPIFW